MGVKKFSEKIPDLGKITIEVDEEKIENLLEQSLGREVSDWEKKRFLSPITRYIETTLESLPLTLGKVFWEALHQESPERIAHMVGVIQNKIKALELEIERLGGFVEKPKQWWGWFSEN